MGSPVNPVTSAEGTGSPTPTGTPVPADTGASPAPGSAAPSPGASPDNQNIRQLREQYEALKKAYEPYEKLGKYEEIQGHVTIAQKLFTTAIEAGTALGYDEAQIRESMAEDPEGTIAFLRNKQAEAERTNGQQPDIKKLLKEELSRELKPFYQEREQQAVEKAHALFDTAFDAQINELFKDIKLTSDELDYLYEQSFHLLERDKATVDQLKKEGKTSGIARIVQAAKAAFDKAYVARSTRESTRIGGLKPNAGEPAAGRKFTLDDIAQGQFPDSMKFA